MAERKPLMAGNWKMHHTHLEAIQVVQKLSYRLEPKDYDEVEVVVCPAFTALRSVQTTIDSDRIAIGLGAQDCHWEPQGAFTGEVSAPMLAKLNVKYVIVGHSERRELFGETDEMVAKKVRAVLGAGMAPILCVGETLEEHEQGLTHPKCMGQVEAEHCSSPFSLCMQPWASANSGASWNTCLPLTGAVVGHGHDVRHLFGNIGGVLLEVKVNGQNDANHR